MMKKKINIILILVVLGLWGSVFYRTLNQYFFSKEIAISTTQTSGKLQLNQINKDTFALQTLSRDPFLNKQTQIVVSPPVKQTSNSTASSIKKADNATYTKPKQIIAWPSISYHGYIKDSRGEMVIIKINQKMFRLRKDALVEGLIIKKISSDSLEVDFNKEKKTIKRFKV